MDRFTLAEKCWLVAVYGDLPPRRRIGLFNVSRFPVKIAGIVMEDGRDFVKRVAQLNPLFTDQPPRKRRRRITARSV